MTVFHFVTKSLYDQTDFYDQFLQDLSLASDYVIIESPFMTRFRWRKIYKPIKRLRERGVRVIVNTKPPDELAFSMAQQANIITAQMQGLGIVVLHTVGHHRKLGIIDGVISWEGSLNILSQYDSCELMRRSCSEVETKELVNFLEIGNYPSYT